MLEWQVSRMPSPLGELIIVTDRANLRSLDFGDCEPRMHELLRARFGDVSLQPADPSSQVREALEAYFAGSLNALDALPVLTGGTPFQQQVWALLRRIQPGTTASYGDLAAQLGDESSARAVGHANSVNPVAIVVPCHRVIGAHGAMTGYAGGLARKEWLLRHEGALLL